MKQVLDTGQYFGNTLSERKISSLILSETSYTSCSRIPLHCHNNFYISYVINGEYNETFSKRKSYCVKGDIIFHPCYTEHFNQFSEKGGTCFNVELTDTFPKEIIDTKLNNYRVFDRGTGILRILMGKIYREYKDYDKFSDIIIEGLLFEALGYSAREINKESSAYWIKKANDIISGSSGSCISLSSIAAELTISPSHLAREFKRSTGVTIGEYIRSIRIEKSCERLKDNIVDIQDIAFEQGFNDQSHFTKVFKKIIGITPKRYREKYHQNKTKISIPYQAK